MNPQSYRMPTIIKVPKASFKVREFIYGLLIGVLIAIPIWAGFYTYAENTKQTIEYTYRLTKFEDNPYSGEKIILHDFVVGVGFQFYNDNCVKIYDENGTGVAGECGQVRVIRTKFTGDMYETINEPLYRNRGFTTVPNDQLVGASSRTN